MTEHIRKEVIGGCTLYLGDCMDVMPSLGRGIAVVSDPPYGIAFSHGGSDNSGIGGGRYATKFAHVAIKGDDRPFDPSHMVAASAECILWGGNHFADRLPSSSSWLIWDKRAASGHSNDFADCELAWTSLKGVARVFRHHWDGMMKASERGIARVQPTQKPIALMEWCVDMVDKALTIVDPYMGSGTTGVACAKIGREFIGIEIDEGYFDVACERIRKAYAQPDMFVAAQEPKAGSGGASMTSTIYKALSQKQTGKKQYALGRLKAGAMNKTEAAYAAYLDTLKSLGDVLWWEFEGIKLRLADNTFLTMDFAVMNSAFEIELYDVKGSFAMMEDDAWVKVKVANSLYPFRFFVVAPVDRKFSAWKVEEV